MSRGVINNRQRALQINDFSGLIRHRGITPTDLDGYIDYRGNAFLFMEGKKKGVDIPKGQRLCFQNLVDALDLAGKLSCTIIYEHNCAIGKDVNVALCEVSKAYFKGKWHPQKRTVLEFIDSFEKYANQIGVKI